MSLAVVIQNETLQLGKKVMNEIYGVIKHCADLLTFTVFYCSLSVSANCYQLFHQCRKGSMIHIK